MACRGVIPCNRCRRLRIEDKCTRDKWRASSALGTQLRHRGVQNMVANAIMSVPALRQRVGHDSSSLDPALYGVFLSLLPSALDMADIYVSVRDGDGVSGLPLQVRRRPQYPHVVAAQIVRPHAQSVQSTLTELDPQSAGDKWLRSADSSSAPASGQSHGIPVGGGGGVQVVDLAHPSNAGGPQGHWPQAGGDDSAPATDEPQQHEQQRPQQRRVEVVVPPSTSSRPAGPARDPHTLDAAADQGMLWTHPTHPHQHPHFGSSEHGNDQAHPPHTTTHAPHPHDLATHPHGPMDHVQNAPSSRDNGADSGDREDDSTSGPQQHRQDNDRSSPYQ